MRAKHRCAMLALAALSVVLAIAGMGLQPARQASALAAPVDPGILAGMAAAPDGTATFLVVLRQQADLSQAESIPDWTARGQYVVDQLRAAADASQPALLERLARRDLTGHVANVQAFWISNVLVVTGDRLALETLARQPEVARILPQNRFQPLQDLTIDDGSAQNAPQALGWGVDRINAPAVWTAPYNAAGQGAVIGIVDTGVQWDHPALQPHYRGWDSLSSTANHNYNWYNPEPGTPCSDPAVPCDTQVHGTHVTGITSGDDGAGEQIGVAPGARWVHALGCIGNNCTDSALLASLQWMLAPTDLAGANPNPALRPHVVNNSWGGQGGFQVFASAVSALRAAGVVPVFAAGNSGSLGCGTLLSPGDNPGAFSVGSTETSDAISSFSSRGPNPFSGQTGPDLAAPGRTIRSARPPDTYGNMSGTSMAAPHAAGAVALLLSAEPDLVGQVDQIEELLRRSSVPSTSAQTCGGVPGSAIPNNAFGWGRLDALAAVEMVWQAGALAGTVTDAVSGQPVPVARVTITRNGKSLSQNVSAGGQFSFVAGSGVYDVAVSAFGYLPWTATGVAVAQDTLTTQDAVLTPLARSALSGQVTEAPAGRAPGDPIAQAKVEVLNAQPPLIALTNPAGQYHLADVPHGAHTLRITAAGYAGVEVPAVVGEAVAQDAALAPAADYLVVDSGTCAPVYAWIDATDGTAHNLADDGTVQVTLPAPFTFYGNPYTSLHISANGYVSFGAAYSLMNGVIPFAGPANNAIYAFAADLNPAGGSQGKVYTKALPGNRFVIEYHQVQHFLAGDPETFEIILDLGSGAITVQYQVVSLPDNALVGVENATGARGRVYSSNNTPPLTAGKAVGFLPFSGPPPSCSPLAVTLAGFSAVQQGDALLVAWETVSELGNAGFNLWRGTSPAGPDRLLNEGIIPSQAPGSASGFVYAWEDRADLTPGATYFFWLEDVNFSGATTRHGPVSARFVGPAAVTLSGVSASPAAAAPGLAWLWVVVAAGAAVGASRLRRRG